VQPYRRARLIAFYLPQFHPIPENDEWWGKGFTEWTNLAKARPLYQNHYQPHVPGELGFYDLRLSETRVEQARLAAEHGIEGFCYWHYWFAGKRLLERPFNEVLDSGQPALPFCLGWANDTWSGIWHGCPDRILVEQTYPGKKEEELHFHALVRAFFDKRYITVFGKPVFLIYKPYKLPEPKRFLEHWQELSIKAGLRGIYFVGLTNTMDWKAEKDGFSAMVPHQPGLATWHIFNPPAESNTAGIVKNRKPDVLFYEEYINRALPALKWNFDEYPCVVPNWDNTPRCGVNGYVLQDSSPELFRTHLREAIGQVMHRHPQKRIIFLKSWNEWAEGNHVEPDVKFGRAYLEACRDEVSAK
jgi:hypothetical protein